jgi:hypothetical protein
LFLNNITLQPFFVLQRFFYNTGLGLTMLAKAECSVEKEVTGDEVDE